MSSVITRFTVKLSDYDDFLVAVRKINNFGPDFEFYEEFEGDNWIEVIEELKYGGYDEIECLVNDPECPPFSYNYDSGVDFYAETGIVFSGYHLSVPCDIYSNPVLPIALEEPNKYDDIAHFYLFMELEKEFDQYCYDDEKQ